MCQIENKKRIRGKNLTEDKTRTKYSALEDYVSSNLNSWELEVLEISEKERDSEYRFLREHGIRVEKTSALAFAGARKYGLDRKNKCVIINTGEGRTYKKKIQHRIYESNLARIAASGILALNLLYGAIHVNNNSVEQMLLAEYNSKICLDGNSPSILEHNLETKQAFIYGRIEPFVNTRQQLQKIAEQGMEYKYSIGIPILNLRGCKA